jgi:hypothetical protein
MWSPNGLNIITRIYIKGISSKPRMLIKHTKTEWWSQFDSRSDVWSFSFYRRV